MSDELQVATWRAEGQTFKWKEVLARKKTQKDKKDGEITVPDGASHSGKRRHEWTRGSTRKMRAETCLGGAFARLLHFQQKHHQCHC